MVCTIILVHVLIYIHVAFCKMGSFKKSITYMYELSKDCQIQLFFSLKSKVDKTVHVRKRFFGISLLLLLIFFQTWIYKKKCFKIHIHVFHVPKITNTGSSRLNLYCHFSSFSELSPCKAFHITRIQKNLLLPEIQWAIPSQSHENIPVLG